MQGIPDFRRGSIEGAVARVLRLIDASPKDAARLFDSPRRRELSTTRPRADGKGSLRRPIATPRIRRHQAELRTLLAGLIKAGAFGGRFDSDLAKVHVQRLNDGLWKYGVGAPQLTLLRSSNRSAELSQRPRKPERSWEGDHLLAIAQAIEAGVVIRSCRLDRCRAFFVPREIRKGPLRDYCSDSCRHAYHNSRDAKKDAKRLNAKLKRGAGAYRRGTANSAGRDPKGKTRK